MGPVRDSEKVQRALSELRGIGEREDVLYRHRVRAREAELGVALSSSERSQLAVDAPLAISDEVGQLVYALVLAARPALIVEFGASLGFSTIYLASAIKDLGDGALITTELLAAKAQRTRGMLATADLDAVVEVCAGDALITLAGIDDPVGMLFLDGANDLYLDVLEMLRPNLAPRALIVADMSTGDPHHGRYREYVNDPANGLLSTELDLDAGVVISTPRPTV